MGHILLLFIFSFSRLYQLSNSLFFFNDWGRDMLVLLKWQQTGLPPLLGPLTSALPFNQSAIYFYLLYPGFLLFQGHPVSSVFTCLLFYILGFYFIKKIFKLNTSLLIVIFLFSIHPQFIIQNRFVWNPSFLPPLLLISVYSFFHFQKEFTKKFLWIFSLSISLAISLSYSAAPLLISFFIYWLFYSRKYIKQHILSLFSGFFLFNLPTLVFEIRHSFFLTKQLLYQNPASQFGNGFYSRLSSIISNLFSTNNPGINWFLFILFLLIVLFLIWYHRSNRGLPFYFSFLFLTTLITSLLLPITFHYQYIFPLLCLLVLVISSFPRFPQIILILFLSFIYLRPSVLQSYFKTPQRTYAQMNQCIKSFCQSFKESVFVSTQASFHPFHNGPEHRYLLRKNGCNVRDIETQNGEANYMVVVEDGDSLTPQTHYYELDLFDKYRESKYFPCTPTFNLRLIEKTNDPPTNN